MEGGGNCEYPAYQHAQAAEVHIRVGRSGGGFELFVTDNGRGFADSGNLRGNGLKNMRRWAADMRGSFEVTSEPGKGCTVRFSAPIPQTRDWKGFRVGLV
jgi:two-component system, NarL family, sensor histidine kinase DevS